MSNIKEEDVNKDSSNAASTHATDGCLEFMASDIADLKCDVCGCHRNFHTKKLVRADGPSRVNSEVKYEGCCKNHGARMGEYSSTDGCLEFMASDIADLKCDVCGCHRNFHTKKLARADGPSRVNSEVKHGDCCKNHAARMGEYSSTDGCLEFMASEGEAGSRDMLMCAACGCHRNFHRKIEEKEEAVWKRPAVSPPSYGSGAAYDSGDDYSD
ncbi:mini zinc finger 2 [Actinidia rufa]|uniref:Mini zinc finger 2 n=1 Tax=Actinidia rufa TaxID=165716 RepID=A0A7J0GAM3_9ERIC|nr:mini zinc finger 2 [Actinidia rufa]